MTNELFSAILAMDAYNRGYNAGIGGLSDALGTQIGTATITARSDSTPNSPEVAADFYAVAYEWNGETIISFRGRDVDAGVRPIGVKLSLGVVPCGVSDRSLLRAFPAWSFVSVGDVFDSA